MEKSVKELYEEAQLAYRNLEFKTALKLFNKIIEAYPKSWQAKNAKDQLKSMQGGDTLKQTKAASNSTMTFSAIQLVPIVLGVIVVSAFFLPWLAFFVTVSGFDLLKDGGEIGLQNTWSFGVPLAIGLVAIVSTLLRKEPLVYGVPAIAVSVYAMYKILSFAKQLGADLGDIQDISDIFTELVQFGAMLTILGLVALFLVSVIFRDVLKRE